VRPSFWRLLVGPCFLQQRLLWVDFDRPTPTVTRALVSQRTQGACFAKTEYSATVRVSLKLARCIARWTGDRAAFKVNVELSLWKKATSVALFGYFGKEPSLGIGEALSRLSAAIRAVCECLFYAQPGVLFGLVYRNKSVGFITCVSMDYVTVQYDLTVDIRNNGCFAPNESLAFALAAMSLFRVCRRGNPVASRPLLYLCLRLA
jgi:hypothetical protein